MKIRYLNWLLFLGLVVCGSFGSAWADRLPAYYPDAFDNIGIVDSISAKRDSIVVGDVFFRLSPQTQVHGLRSEKVTLGWVGQGARIGFSIAENFITEIWILPQDYNAGGEE